MGIILFVSYYDNFGVNIYSPVEMFQNNKNICKLHQKNVLETNIYYYLNVAPDCSQLAKITIPPTPSLLVDERTDQ